MRVKLYALIVTSGTLWSMQLEPDLGRLVLWAVVAAFAAATVLEAARSRRRASAATQAASCPSAGKERKGR